MPGRREKPKVNFESPARMTRHRLCSWLLCAALLLGTCAAWGEPYRAQEENLQRFFTALSVPLGVSVVLSRKVARLHVSGTFDFDAPQQVLEVLAMQEGLIWYRDGQVLYLYDADEARSSAVALRHISVDRLRGLMRRTGLDESSYPLRKSGERTFYVTGPPSYVDQVLRLAQLMDRQPVQPRVDSPTVGVVQVFNVDVADRQSGTGADTITVPGMASMIDARLSREHKAQLADGSLTLIAYPDTNSLLIKGKPDQVSLIKQWVAELDVLTRSDVASSWQAGADHNELKTPAGPPGPSLLTAEQQERVHRAFVQRDREISP
jgi:type II secretory pathway component GspD/PulD (secretin)